MVTSTLESRPKSTSWRQSITNAAARIATSISYRFHVAAANAWRDNYNPLRGLTIQRAVAMLEDGERGAFADLQWTYRYIEMQDATLGALVERRTSAIQQLDWDIRVSDSVPPEKQAIADRQAQALREAYDRIANLSQAIESLALASFRGYAHLEKVTDEHGNITELTPVDQWFWVRKGLYGDWHYNRTASFGSNSGEPVPLPRFVIREVARPINRVALIAFLRKNLSQKDWDGFIEAFGIPAVFVIMPPTVPPEKVDEYQAAADQVTSDARGVLPGGSDVKTVDSGARGKNPFKEHLEYQDQQMVLRGTGGLLTMLAQSGSGTLAGGAHSDTFAAIAKAEAAEISELLRRTIDADILARITPGEKAWAGFVLAANEETDTTAIVSDVTKLKGAGYSVRPEWIAEKTGYDIVVPAPINNSDRLVAQLCKLRKRDDTTSQNLPASPSEPSPASSSEADSLETDNFIQHLRSALSKDLQPLGDALWAAYQSGDILATQAALKKISKDLPDYITTPALESLLGEQFAAAFIGEGTDDDNASIYNTGNSAGAIKGWETRRRNGWVPAPRLITPAQADAELDQGVFIKTAKGKTVKFGIQLKRKLDRKVVVEEDRNARKQRLPWAKLAVAEGAFEILDPADNRGRYAKTFRNGKKHQDIEVLVDTVGGYAWNIMIKKGSDKNIH